MTITFVNYIVYLFYPLPLAIPRWFPWPWWVSLTIALIVSIPAAWVWVKGMKDAGRETMQPSKDQVIFTGIYQKIRHPQAVGEHTIWVMIGLAFHSPFLFIYSLIWIPAAMIMCYAEEKDLLIRYGGAYEKYRQQTGAFFPKSWILNHPFHRQHIPSE